MTWHRGACSANFGGWMYNDFKELLSALNAHRVRYLVDPASERSREQDDLTRDSEKGIDDDIEP